MTERQTAPDNDARYDDSRERSARDHGDNAANARDAWMLSAAQKTQRAEIGRKADAEKAYLKLHRETLGPSRSADVQAEMDRLAEIAWPA